MKRCQWPPLPLHVHRQHLKDRKTGISCTSVSEWVQLIDMKAPKKMKRYDKCSRILIRRVGGERSGPFESTDGDSLAPNDSSGGCCDHMTVPGWSRTLAHHSWASGLGVAAAGQRLLSQLLLPARIDTCMTAAYINSCQSSLTYACIIIHCFEITDFAGMLLSLKYYIYIWTCDWLMGAAHLQRVMFSKAFLYVHMKGDTLALRYMFSFSSSISCRKQHFICFRQWNRIKITPL